MTLWQEALTAVVPKHNVNMVLDLGCGTGRFTAALAEAFECSAIGVEPSAAMLDVARARLSEPPAVAGGSMSPRHSQLDSSSDLSRHSNLHFNIAWRQAAAENLPLEAEAVDLVFMSQVFHHLVHPRRALQEIHRVLTARGYLGIRNGMREENGRLAWLQFFPAAREIEEQRTPSRAELTDAVGSQSFALISHRTIDQLFAASHEEYFEKISRRGLSSLIAISDQDFQSGLEEFRDWANSQPPDAPIHEPVDLFIFQKIGV